MITYGRQSLPILIRKHPELKALVKANLQEPIALFGEAPQLSIKKILYHLALWNVIGGLAILIARMLNPLVAPAVLFDYLIFYHAMKGFRSLGERRGAGDEGPAEQSDEDIALRGDGQ